MAFRRAEEGGELVPAPSALALVSQAGAFAFPLSELSVDLFKACLVNLEPTRQAHAASRHTQAHVLSQLNISRDELAAMTSSSSPPACNWSTMHVQSYVGVCPACTAIVEPLMKDDRSLARKSIVSAISFGSAARPIVFDAVKIQLVSSVLRALYSTSLTLDGCFRFFRELGKHGRVDLFRSDQRAVKSHSKDVRLQGKCNSL